MLYTSVKFTRHSPKFGQIFVYKGEDQLREKGEISVFRKTNCEGCIYFWPHRKKYGDPECSGLRYGNLLVKDVNVEAGQAILEMGHSLIDVEKAFTAAACYKLNTK